jgi:hypothetical protein
MRAGDGCSFLEASVSFKILMHNKTKASNQTRIRGGIEADLMTNELLTCPKDGSAEGESVVQMQGPFEQEGVRNGNNQNKPKITTIHCTNHDLAVLFRLSVDT